MAPIGDKGQFKDFCEQECMSKYEVLHLGKVLEKETLPCSVCKEIRVVEQEIIRYKYCTCEDLRPMFFIFISDILTFCLSNRCTGINGLKV